MLIDKKIKRIIYEYGDLAIDYEDDSELNLEDVTIKAIFDYDKNLELEGNIILEIIGQDQLK